MTTLTEHLIQCKAGLWKLFQHDVNMKQAMLRGAAAKGFGLPPEQYAQPFPGETSLTVVSQPADAPQAAPAPAKGNWLHTALLGGALLAAGPGTLVALLASGLVGPKPGPAPVLPAPVVAQPSAPQPPGLNPWDEIQEVQQPDGTFQEKPGTRQPFGKFPKEWMPPNGGILP